MLAPTLRADEIHVWSARLDRTPSVTQRLGRNLSDDERERAARFHFDRDRNRFIVGRALLRIMLARYLGVAADQIRFAYGEFGKPSLAEPAPVFFNVSHAEARALYAFSLDAELGIDTERFGVEPVDQRVAEHFFAAGEVATLRSLPRSLQPGAFLTCWTRKEAFLKARGDGLSLPLQDFEVTLAPDQPPALVQTAWSEDEPRRWKLYDLSWLGPGYVSALATMGSGRVVAREYPGNEMQYEKEEW
jgi:4'-phosphopantetheinyl transferase